MKKAAKILLIIALLLGIIYLGYLAYGRFMAPKTEKIDKEEGISKYVVAVTKTLEEEKYSVSYEKSVNDGKNKVSTEGYITIDEYGFYHRWDGDKTGNIFMVNIGSRYGVFSKNGEDKTSSTMTVNEFNTASKIYNSDDYLSFLKFVDVTKNEDNIAKVFYSDVAATDGKFSHTYSIEDGKYVWETVYTCTYKDGDKQYASTFTRKVYFDDEAILSVNFSKKDKELNNKGKAKLFGSTRKVEANFILETKTNKLIVETDFSKYPEL